MVGDWILGQINGLINIIMAGLPDSPFPSLIGSIPVSTLQTINWVIPLGSMLTVLSGWLVAVAIFYVFRIILAWIKAIGS